MTALSGRRFALFADCLLVGCFTAIAALPVITAYPAMVAACSLLRERVVDDHSAGPLRYLKRLGQVVRSGPAGLLVPLLIEGLLALDALAVGAGIPGSWLFAVLLTTSASAVAVLGLRAATSWRPGARWPVVMRAAAGAAVRDPGGSALLLLATAAAIATALAVPMTILLVAGTLALAAVGVDLRHRSRENPSLAEH
jgi:hypothetical protein